MPKPKPNRNTYGVFRLDDGRLLGRVIAREMAIAHCLLPAGLAQTVSLAKATAWSVGEEMAEAIAKSPLLAEQPTIRPKTAINPKGSGRPATGDDAFCVNVRLDPATAAKFRAVAKKGAWVRSLIEQNIE